MAISNFIPEIWADELLDRWENEAVFPQLVSRKYEGIASKGNVVHLTGVTAPTIKNYKTGVLLDDLAAPIARTTKADEISDTGVDLLIDQEKSFDFKVHDIDRVQAAGSFQDYTNAAGDGLAVDSDTFLAALLATNGTVQTAVAITDGDSLFNQIVEARKLLQLAKVPAAQRVLAINAEAEAVLLKADSKLSSFDTSGDTGGLRNATIGNLLGFRVVSAAHLPVSNKPQFIAFHQTAAAYVSQIDSVEALRDNDSFADRVRGLHVYGGKVVKATGIRVFTAS